MPKKKNEQSLEDQLSRLEEISHILDTGQIPLEEQLTLYAEGVKLAAACREYLETAELRVIALGQDASSEEDDEA